jgi:AGCS family alanine or glycine:cation symporter
MTSDSFFQKIADFGNNLLFFDIFFWTDKISMPFLIFWLLASALYFSFITKFLNFRKLPFAVFEFIRGKKTINKQNGTVSSKSIVLSAIAGATDIGSISGLASVIVIGGAGTIFWLIVAGFLSTSIRYAEVFCGHKFRKKVFQNGKSIGYIGGPQIYIKRIFSLYKLKQLGIFVAKLYAVMLCLSTFCSLQVNQAVQIITHTVPSLHVYAPLIALAVATVIILIAYKGISRVASFNQKAVPVMIVVYIISTLLVFITHYKNIIPAIQLIFSDAFSFRAVNGGILGSLVLGAQRAFFCNESGMGSGAIIHANSSNNDSKKEAIISMITPIVSVLIVCLCSGMIVLVSKSYVDNTTGVDSIINAFASVHPAMKYLNVILIPTFGITTAVAWSYYGSRQFASLFGNNKVLVYYTLLFVAYFLCGIANDFGVILDVADFLNLSITIPNIIALLMISRRIR